MMRVAAVLCLVLSCGFCFAQTKSVAITIDDLPYSGLGSKPGDVKQAREDIAKILATLKSHQVPVVGFVNEIYLNVDGQRDMRVALLQQWLDGGAELGNHTYSHVNINQVPEAHAEDEVVEGEVITQRLMKENGKQERYFRHPFLRTGATLDQKQQFEAFLKSRGYTVAPVTAENLDWAFDTARRVALKEGDHATAERILDAYLAQTESSLEYYEKLTQALFGRNIPFIMLMHSNQLNALMLDKVLAEFEARGYKFVSVEEALKDPAYQTTDTYAGNEGKIWQDRWAFSLGKNLGMKAPESPQWMWDLYKKASVAGY